MFYITKKLSESITKKQEKLHCKHIHNSFQSLKAYVRNHKSYCKSAKRVNYKGGETRSNNNTKTKIKKKNNSENLLICSSFFAKNLEKNLFVNVPKKIVSNSNVFFPPKIKGKEKGVQAHYIISH